MCGNVLDRKLPFPGLVLLFANGGSNVILNDGVTERIVTSVFNSPHCHLGISPRGLADVFGSNL